MRVLHNPAERFERLRARTYTVAGLVIPRRATHLLLVVVACAALLAIVAATFWIVSQARSVSGSVELMQQRKFDLWDIMRLVQDAETGQRGYLLTENPDYLQPYERALKRLPERQAHLHELADIEPDLASRINALDRLIADKLSELGATIRTQEAGDRAGALAMVRSNRGREIMLQIRSSVEELAHSQELGVSALGESSRYSGTILIVGNLFAAALLLVIATGAIWIVRRDTAVLERARTDLTRLNTSLTGVVDKRTQDLLAANEEIQRFAYIVSHDLRSPLVNVMGFTSELEACIAIFGRQLDRIEAAHPELIDEEAQAAVRDDVPEAIGFIRSATAKMDRLINAILRLSRDGRRVLTPEDVALGDVFAAAIAGQEFQIEREGIAIEVAKPLPRLVTDRLAFEQVVSNLVDNAIKYLEAGRPGRVQLSGRELGPYVEVTIADNGRGIDAKDHERVFELFRRAGAQDKAGEGLGLAFVRAAVRRLGGTIELRSKLGEGTTFILRMPKILHVNDGAKS